LTAKQNALKAQEERAYEELSRLSAQISRLRKQQNLLQARRAEMLRRGLSSLEELEEEECREEEERVRAEQQQVASPSSPGFVFDGDLSSFPDLLDFGVPGEIVQPGPSSSSGS
jgi:transposase